MFLVKIYYITDDTPYLFIIDKYNGFLNIKLKQYYTYKQKQITIYL